MHAPYGPFLISPRGEAASSVSMGVQYGTNPTSVCGHQDAINFFAQYGSHTPIKFVHLIRAHDDDSVNYRPYDLLVVNPRDCGPDYYTMSAAGEHAHTHTHTRQTAHRSMHTYINKWLAREYGGLRRAALTNHILVLLQGWCTFRPERHQSASHSVCGCDHPHSLVCCATSGGWAQSSYDGSNPCGLPSTCIQTP
jgi:hypothetical protein